jgi:cation diffusion facilitator CzcD-associated flavoprotein CzcO
MAKAQVVSAAQEAEVAGEVDVLVVGAGISGIDAAYHLQTYCPGKTFVLLENQAEFGGTWRTHRYPGIRSDSDLYTFGYRWKPWMSAPIATAEEILKYLDEVLDEQDLRRHIRYRTAVEPASWDSGAQRWTVTVRDGNSGRETVWRTKFLWMCQGYYRHDEGYTPEWPGFADFQGRVVHPQTWPEDLDYSNQRVLVIGSGATAATVVPAMARTAAHVTMLQRSPTYFSAAPNRNETADMLRELEVPEEWVHEITRRKILADQEQLTRRSFEEPEVLREELKAIALEYLGEDFDFAAHFEPSYRPWQQRLAFLPDGDLFVGLREGQASVVTGEIDRFVANGVRLKSGEVLEADLVVTATGFELSVLGDIAFEVDGDVVDFAETVTWRGMMFSGVPNMAWVFGYFRASWTLRADLISELLCRMFAQMDERGEAVVTPVLSDAEAGLPRQPWIDPDNFNPGYLTRSLHLLPSQLASGPWQFTQDYWRDKDEFPVADLRDGSLRYDAAVDEARAAARSS